MMHSYK